LVGAPGGYIYRATVPAGRQPAVYTARVIPRRAGVAVPLENSHILWQR
jgi:starch phosphorylase